MKAEEFDHRFDAEGNVTAHLNLGEATRPGRRGVKRRSRKDVREQLRREVLRLASSCPEVRSVILFGSRARGDAQEGSDVDLAIVAPEATQRQWLDLAFALEELESLSPIQVVRLGDVSPELRDRILAEGEVWYDRG